jgi:hypothetical protein
LWYYGSALQYPVGARIEETDVPCASRTPGLIRELPGHNGRLVDVAANEGFDVILVRGDNVCVRVEQVVIRRTEDLCRVDVHTTVVGPVVRPVGVSFRTCVELLSEEEKARTVQR